jgi:hypothetical protein
MMSSTVTNVHVHIHITIYIDPLMQKLCCRLTGQPIMALLSGLRGVTTAECRLVTDGI